MLRYNHQSPCIEARTAMQLAIRAFVTVLDSHKKCTGFVQPDSLLSNSVCECSYENSTDEQQTAKPTP